MLVNSLNVDTAAAHGLVQDQKKLDGELVFDPRSLSPSPKLPVPTLYLPPTMCQALSSHPKSSTTKKRLVHKPTKHLFSLQPVPA